MDFNRTIETSETIAQSAYVPSKTQTLAQLRGQLCLNIALLSSTAVHQAFIWFCSVTALLPAVIHELDSLYLFHYPEASTL